jgi:hypothetical protein
MKPWGQHPGKPQVVHRAEARAQVVVSEPRAGTPAGAQGSSLSKCLIAQAKMAFSTGSGLLYYYDHSEKKRQ